MDPSNRRQFRREVSRKASTMISWGMYNQLQISLTSLSLILYFFYFIEMSQCQRRRLVRNWKGC